MRGVFVSLSAVLLIGIILISVIANQQRAEEETQIELDYLQNRLAKEYLDVLDRATIPRAVAYHAKNEFAKGAAIANPSVLSSRIDDGVLSDVESEYLTLSLSFSSIELTDIGVTGWSQPDEWTITIDYEYTLTATSSPGIEWDISGDGSVDISVIGFRHPEFPAGTYGRITRDFWGINSSGNTNCVLDSIGSYTCGSIRQVCPYAFPECRP